MMSMLLSVSSSIYGHDELPDRGKRQQDSSDLLTESNIMLYKP